MPQKLEGVGRQGGGPVLEKPSTTAADAQELLHGLVKEHDAGGIGSRVV